MHKHTWQCNLVNAKDAAALTGMTWMRLRYVLKRGRGPEELPRAGRQRVFCEQSLREWAATVPRRGIRKGRGSRKAGPPWGVRP